jgi:cyanophycinase-like exopeptidase
MHFVVRDRMGRLVGFLANALHRGFPPAGGFACNEKTSFVLDTTSGIGQVVGQGPAYALTPTTTPSVLEKETPLTWYNVSTQRLDAGDFFDFVKFKALDELNIPYMLNVDDGDLSAQGNGGKIY